MQLPLFSCSATEPSSACVTLAEVQQRPSEVPLVIADGLGVNSTALLIGLSRADVRPDLILFADTGSEKPKTYVYLDIRRQWLRRVGFPNLIVACRRGVRVPDQSLKDQCLRTGTLPSLAYGGKSCSLKWKVARKTSSATNGRQPCGAGVQVSVSLRPSATTRAHPTASVSKNSATQSIASGIRCGSSGWTGRPAALGSGPWA